MNIQLRHNQTQFCYIIKFKQINVGIVQIKHENIKLINGKASSSTLVEELASRDKRNYKETN
jgi:hypothetical protein